MVKKKTDGDSNNRVFQYLIYVNLRYTQAQLIYKPGIALQDLLYYIPRLHHGISVNILLYYNKYLLFSKTQATNANQVVHLRESFLQNWDTSF